MDVAAARALIASIPHWHQRFEILPGVETPGSYAPEFLLQKLELPEDLTGIRILEIGPSDGFFTLALTRRGAQLTVVDYRPKDSHGFGVMERLAGIQFDYRHANLYDITAAEYGMFDHVLCLGVLYHAPDMMKTLAVLRSVCSGRIYIETESVVDEPEPVARYYKADSLAGDSTNFWAPSPSCVADMLHDAAFDVIRTDSWGGRRFFAVAEIARDPQRARKLLMGYGVFS